MKNEDIIYKYGICEICNQPHWEPEKTTIKEAKEMYLKDRLHCLYSNSRQKEFLETKLKKLEYGEESNFPKEEITRDKYIEIILKQFKQRLEDRKCVDASGLIYHLEPDYHEQCAEDTKRQLMEAWNKK